MPQRIDPITGQEFRSSNPEEKLAPETRKLIVSALVHDPETRKEVISAICTDAGAMNAMAKSILSVKCSEIGLSVPGTVAEFFLELRDSRSKKKAQYSNKKA